jgi:DNA-binding MarR family transcriptional regulator
MTRLVDGLEKRAWVERIRSTQDRRKVSVALTPAGRAEALRLRGLAEQAVVVLLQGLPAEKHD